MSAPEPAKSGGSDLASRLGTAAIALPLLLAGMLWASPWVGFAIVTAAVALGAWEYDALLVARGLKPFRVTGAALLAAVYVRVAVDGAAMLGATPWCWMAAPATWPVAGVLVLTALLFRAQDFARDVPSAGLTLLGAAYLGGLGGSIAALRVMEPLAEGAWRIVFLLAIVMASDTAAYFTGRALGRHKLAPAISPGKTIEGAVGGLGGGVLGALAVRGAGFALPLGHAIALGVVVALLGMAGDLVESLLKRWAGVKDSGRLFPGHGGMLDRLDSLLFGAAVLYYYFSFNG